MHAGEAIPRLQVPELTLLLLQGLCVSTGQAIWAVLPPTTLYMFSVDRARGMKRTRLCRPKS